MHRTGEGGTRFGSKSSLIGRGLFPVRISAMRRIEYGRPEQMLKISPETPARNKRTYASTASVTAIKSRSLSESPTFMIGCEDLSASLARASIAPTTRLGGTPEPIILEGRAITTLMLRRRA